MMRTCGLGVLLLWALPALAQDEGRVAVSLGYGAMAGPPARADSGATVGGSGAAYLSFRVLDEVAIEVGGREGIASGDLRVIGAIQVAAKVSPWESLYLRGGFVHHHETPWDAYRKDPILATLGSGEGIRHRSGADLGVGLSWDLPTASTPVSTSVEVSAVGFPDPSGPRVYGVVQHLFTIGL